MAVNGGIKPAAGRLEGRVAIVTGANRGIGLATAKHLSAEGASVLLTGRDEAALEEARAEITAAGGTTAACSADLDNAADRQRVVDTAAEQLGPIDVLVNNAGITRDMTFKKMAKSDWDAVISTNLDSVFNMSKQVLDGMVDRGWGRIINVSSVNGQKGAFGQTNYSAAKAGMHGFTKALAYEVARKGVTVNTISPGYIGTKMVTAIPQDILDSKILPQIPLNRLGLPAEVAGLIIYLASDEAAFVTGANISINGGQHMS
jgi:acetoacetyl-CoA reductase